MTSAVLRSGRAYGALRQASFRQSGAVAPLPGRMMWRRGFAEFNEAVFVGDRRVALPYEGCTILTALDSVGMGGRADCRQGICGKCAVDVCLDDGEVYQVRACKEMAIDGIKITIPPKWRLKAKWEDPHPEKVRVVTRNTDPKQSSPQVGRKLKGYVQTGNYAFRQKRWNDVIKTLDDIDEFLTKVGFSAYLDFQRVSTLARDVLPDYVTAVSLADRAGFGPVPKEMMEKARDLADALKENLEANGRSAAAYSSEMDEGQAGSHGAGKRGRPEEAYGGGSGVENAAFFRNFSVWPEDEPSALPPPGFAADPDAPEEPPIQRLATAMPPPRHRLGTVDR